jgi:hypothetical protein
LTRLASIRYQTPTGNWELFNDIKLPPMHPESIQLSDDTVLTFDSMTSGRAKDDDGKMVAKNTWDYYDFIRQRNIAIEIWKENDRDYPEAYDGKVVNASEIQLLAPEEIQGATKKIKSTKVIHYSFFIVAGMVAFFAFISGIPFDYLLAASSPVLSLCVLYQYNNSFWNIAFGATWLIFTGLLFLLWNGIASYWAVMLVLLVISVFVMKTMGIYYLDKKEEIKPLIFTAVFLPGTWIYSFYMYFTYAPGPHNVEQLMVTCVLPIFLTGVLFFVNWALD